MAGGFTPICRGQAWVSNSRKSMRNAMQYKGAGIDSERRARIQEALRKAQLSAVVCSLPSNVLLLTGYWPVVGTSIAICVRDGPTVLLVPEDETELAQDSFADSIETFVPETLNEMRSASEAIRPHLVRVLKTIKLHHGSIGVECRPSSQATSYLALHLYGDSLSNMLRALLPAATLAPIEEWLGALKSVKTPLELSRIRQACHIAQKAYELGSPLLRAGMKESEAAQLFRASLSGGEISGSPNQRCDGFAFCMSGPNSATAYAAYARTRFRTLEQTDLVMIHCNSYVDGFWTDITRTYTLGPPDDRQIKMHCAVLGGRKAALEAIKPGVRATEVDSAAREAIQSSSLDKYLKHGTGHGVGFSPMSAYSIPRLHSGSTDVLQEGMVFNVEPALYIQGYGGVRHCDVVAVTRTGYELLTEFQSDIESLAVTGFNHTPAKPAQSTIVAESNSIRTNSRLAIG
ncbi:MAG: M24 family metallopeptidase [Candidatus Acidiferrales bacterium]